MGWDNVYLRMDLTNTLVQKTPKEMTLQRFGYTENPEYYLAACYLFDHPEMLDENEYFSICIWIGDTNIYRPLRVGDWTPDVHDGREPRMLKYERDPNDVINAIFNVVCDVSDDSNRRAFINCISVFFHSQRLIPSAQYGDGLEITNHVLAKVGEHDPNASMETKAFKELIQEANKEMPEGLSNYVDSARKLKAIKEQSESQYKIFYPSNLS